MGEGKNRLYYGDNLEVLRRDVPSESVDLVYLDPPFNSNRNYNVLFKKQDGTQANAQIQAFDDTWSWSQDDELLYLELIGGASASRRVADALAAFYKLLGPSDMMSYLVMMAVRLIELHRVLKPTGSLYLHCDPVASHYLKILLDAIFGPEQFRNEVIWLRTGAKGSKMKRFPSNHDSILVFSKSDGFVWNEVLVPYDLSDLDDATLSKYSQIDVSGRRYQLTSLLHPEQGQRPNLEYEVMGVTRTWRWSKDRMEAAIAAGRVVQTAPGRVPREKRYLDEQKGRVVSDVWTDIPPLNSQAAERLGYPTQKPLALLERIIQASSNPGDVVLDPFCGCGTAVDAAQRMDRRWIGIDITWLAVDLIDSRLEATYGPEVKQSYEVHGIPVDVEGAKALFNANPFDFERWVVSFVDGHPNDKQVGDKGIDGVVRFWETDKTTGEMIVSVKGGATVNPSMVRDLAGTVLRQNAEMGLLITLTPPTKGMIEEVNHSGTYERELTGKSYPKLQIITVAELLEGKRPSMPEPINPYVQAKRRGEEPLRLFT
jgi:site-specific DNA-methyltransferase (adenine-specific)